MNKMITEDIIRQALNESIDEFMLEEAWGGWNALKGWGNKWGLDKAARGIRNWAANYMNKRTNGKWNAKYGIYDDNTYKSIRSKNSLDYFNDLMAETKYLKTWFDTHAKNANDILNYKDGPTYSKYGKNNFFNTSVWMGASGATQYIKSYCTYENYLEYTQRYFTDYQGNQFIEGYINEVIQPLADQPQKAIQKISFGAFNWSSYGKQFYNQSREDRNAYLDKQQQVAQQKKAQTNQQQQQQQVVKKQTVELTKIKTELPKWQQIISNKFGKPDWNKIYAGFTNNTAIPDNMKQFVKYFVNYAINANDATLLNKSINYATYLKYYGKYYQKEALNAVPIK